jgi:hypothetical protein
MRSAWIGAAILAATLAAAAQPSPKAQPSAAPAPQLTTIDWAEVRNDIKNQRLQRVRQMKMAIAPNAPTPSLPMLLPFEATLLATAANVFPRPDSYAASMRAGDITVEVHGERRVAVLAKDDPLMRLGASKLTGMVAGRAVPIAIDKTEGGFDVTFNRFGAAYLISIECRQPETDERCTKPAFIQNLAERMALAGPDAP